MTLVRWTPRSMLGFRNEIDQLFNSCFNTPVKEETTIATFAPAVDIEEKDKEFRITIELPGIKKEEVSIKIKDNLLTITGDKKKGKKTEDENYHRTERIYGSFQRTFRLPEYADQDNIAAEYKDGILIVSIPKLKESISKNVEIKIK
ncbi:MAG: Hsp20/alpha crystallin family protein [Candidatus Marinimicrobia bacterium]|nr:Hsp20/alpha crystallin family protein [Candidatus Neomarinimicrobiota bacterium]